jgi:hypothetical protein
MYTRGDEITLPSDDTNLETNYSAQDYLYVNLKDDDRVEQEATEQYAIHQFKDFVGTNPSTALEWEGQSGLAPSISPVYLQIYNQDSNLWETVDSNNTEAADTDFILEADILDLTDYRDGSNVISCRVYQLMAT